MYLAAIVLTFAALIATSVSDDSTVKAVVIPASEYFEGNDGPWSTFDIRVGTPEQYMRVLVSTASPESMVALSEYACSTSVFATVPPNCAVSRGNLFSLNTSTSWDDVGTYGINQNGVGLEANLGYTQKAQFGLEHLGIGLTGPGLDNQTVAGIATPEPFYLGIFGLNSQPVNFSTLGNYSSPSFLTTLKEQKKIPSLSWSYTAGAKYRLKQVYGQLIFSGYDTSRFKENSVSFTMAGDLTRDLVVALQSISYSGSTSATLLSDSINIYIDSTDPNIWLPANACDAFEKAFGLSLDAKSGLYLVNDTHHNTLLNSNAEVTFRLSDVKSGGDTVAVTLPYAAFDLTAEYPLVDSSSRYFPLKRANSSTQYTLGRTFLQEAYLSADYERKVFNVSACVWHEGSTENIVTITSKDSNTTTVGGGGEGGGSSSSEGSHLSQGALAGIIAGCVIFGLLLIAAIVFVILRKRRKWINFGFAVAGVKPEPDEAILKGPVFNEAPRSMADDSMPHSADDVSAVPRSTAHGSSTTGTPPKVSMSENTTSTSSPDSVSHAAHNRQSTELDGKEVSRQQLNAERMPPVAESPAVYELPGSEVADGKRREAVASSSRDQGEGGNNSPASPLVSTMGTNWGDDERPDADLVSPTTPPRREARLF